MEARSGFLLETLDLECFCWHPDNALAEPHATARHTRLVWGVAPEKVPLTLAGRFDTLITGGSRFTSDQESRLFWRGRITNG